MGGSERGREEERAGPAAASKQPRARQATRVRHTPSMPAQSPNRRTPRHKGLAPHTPHCTHVVCAVVVDAAPVEADLQGSTDISGNEDPSPLYSRRAREENVMWEGVEARGAGRAKAPRNPL